MQKNTTVPDENRIRQWLTNQSITDHKNHEIDYIIEYHIFRPKGRKHKQK